ncbi:hypothetical protein TNCV_900281 [Trichonephila clavipes]|nr:hypothetical protein TNCV_900281 [Trichonephila clavipes]
MSMNRYTNAKLADVQRPSQLKWTCCCSVDGERYPTRWQPNHQTFTRVYQNLAEHGSFRVTIDDTSVNYKMYLVAGISIAAAAINETPGI